jgi:hypothetical protein
MLTTLLMAAATTLAGIIVRIFWNRKIGRHLRAQWHRRWLKGRDVVPGHTLIRRPGPSTYETFLVADIDGSDVLLERTTARYNISVWLPIARLRREGVEIVVERPDGGQS